MGSEMRVDAPAAQVRELDDGRFEQALRLWEEAIREMEAEKLFVILNNHFQGKAIANALMLMKALGKEAVPPPPVQEAYGKDLG